MELKISSGLWCLGGCGDRYNLSGYSSLLPTLDTIKLARSIPGVKGVELAYPTGMSRDVRAGEVDAVKTSLAENDLQASALLVNTYTDPKWQLGSFGAGDPAIRAEAVKLGKQAADFASAVGCPAIGLWLGQDGFDYPFQIDYEDHWGWLVEGVREVAAYRPEIKIALEYKLKEPRTHMSLAAAAKTLVFCDEVGLPNVGVSMDFGHSLVCRESPGEAVMLLARHNRLFNVHLNDNFREWDDDLIVGTVHVWETLEFLYWIKKVNYQGWLGIDQFPYRENAVDAVGMSVQNIQALASLVDQIDVPVLRKAQNTMSAIETQQLIRKLLFQ